MISTIALLTDFGTSDWYVAAMKGVMLNISPDVNLIDITHNIEPGNVDAAAFVLANCWRDFPSNTIFLVVVDPGVGTTRKPICARAGRTLFVGPDNGVFSAIAFDEVRELKNDELFTDNASCTFHGRDIFAPAAAYLSMGFNFLEIGDVVEAPITRTPAAPLYEPEFASGQILYFDRFGNAISNIEKPKVAERFPLEDTQVTLKEKNYPLSKTFSDVGTGEVLAYFGSGGYLEFAVNLGSARQKLGLELGDPVTITEA